MLFYEADSGHFYWKVARRPDLKGVKAGYAESKGYIVIEVDGRAYKSHRLVWLYIYGTFPADQLDHINGDRSDNRLSNLRPASNLENCRSKSVYKNSRSGIKGVHLRYGKWVARIRVEGRLKHLGCYNSLEEATAAYDQAAHRFFGEFARTNAMIGGVS